ncbi:MAG: helix-turn-helix transcriptional regulator [Chloroflexi bacterium]|nr:helix-turn-helix transcriptional regulator [Chloroflexota bacterium]
MGTNEIRKLRGRIAESGIRQQALASAMGMDPSALSAVLNERRRTPDGFVERTHAALERLEEAEAAADEARQRVLAGASE